MANVPAAPDEETPKVEAQVSDMFGPMSPVLTLNDQPTAWIESPMLLRRVELEFWAQRMRNVG